MNTAVVTVIMPVYNAAKTLDLTVRSILDQNMAELELIAIDDGSVDESLALLLKHAEHDPRVRVISCPNGGVSKARNRGVEMASTPYIAFIDSDDIWHPDKLSRHLALHEIEPELAASYARIAFLPQDATDISGFKTISGPPKSYLKLGDILGENPVCTMSNLFMSRSWFNEIGGMDSRLSHAEDQDYIANLLSWGARIKGIDAVLVGYRFSPDGLSIDFDRMHEGWRTLASQYIENSELQSLEALYCRYLARRTLRAGTSPLRTLGFVFAGLRLDAAAFFGDGHRGYSTLLAALVAPFLPALVRRQIFA